MYKDDLLYLSHMLEMARKATARTEGINRDDYDNDEDLRLALTHLVQVVGEAAGRVSPQTVAAYPEVPWREIGGMRHKIVHDYLNVDEDVVREVVTEDLPPLVATLETIVRAEDTD